MESPTSSPVSGKGKRSLESRYHPLELVSSTQYLVSVKIGSTVLGNTLKQSDLARLWIEMCPNKDWLTRGEMKTAISKACGISVTTIRRVLAQQSNLTSKWSYTTTEKSVPKDFFEENIANKIFHLKPDSRGGNVTTLAQNQDNAMISVELRGVGRPSRPDLADLDGEWSERLRKNLLPWLVDYAPVTSGTRGARRFRNPTWRLGYNSYRRWAIENNKDVIGYGKFRDFLGDACIGPSDYSYFVCPYCLLKDGDPIKGIHKEQCEYQFNAYSRQKEQVEIGTLFLVVDWARIHECRGKTVEILQVVKGKLVWKKLLITFSDLGFALYVKTETGQLKTHFVNCFALLPQRANFFKAGVAKVAEYVHKKGWKVERIFSWADNGLRNYNCLFTYLDFFDHFPDLKSILVCHFPPHHGHGLVDANFGVLKRYLRIQFCGIGPVDPSEAFVALEKRKKKPMLS